MQRQHPLRCEFRQLQGGLARRQGKIEFIMVAAQDRQPARGQRLALRWGHPDGADPVTIAIEKVVIDFRFRIVQAMAVNQLASAGSQFPLFLLRFTLQIEPPILLPLVGGLGFGLAARFRLTRRFLSRQRLVFLALMVLLAAIGIQFFSLVRRRQPRF